MEVAAGIGLVSGGTGAAGGGIAGSVATGGASLLVTAAGASAISAGWTAIVQGATGALAGLATIADLMSMMSSGSGSGPSGSATSAAGGARTPRAANQAQREAALERSKGADGVEKCTYCSKPLDRKSGAPNSAEIDHRRAYSKGGETVDANLDAACRTCNRSKGNRELGTEWVPPKQRQP
ncbi:MAG: HNH endonuclease [Polyangiaceae bacterium]|nr:HNH endonuclease [Polyangiaceae bacterium]